MENKIKLIRRLIAEGENFTFENFSYLRKKEHGTYGGDDTPAWMAWKSRSYNVVQQLVGEGSASLQLVGEGMKVATVGYHEDSFQRAKALILTGLNMTIDVIEIDSFGEVRQNETIADKSLVQSAPFSKRVFVVHGHDQFLKTDVERFIHQIGLEPVVLHRQPDKGQTLIEKFEANSDVGYAFILLTPDEFAFTTDQEKLPDAERKKELRARPNVIFEFGFFVGKLGRQRVCCIYKEGVVLPSDLTGLIYKKVSDSIDPQAYSIIQELKAAGYKVQI